MKKILLYIVFVCSLCLSGNVIAQNNVSSSKSFHITKQIIPPILDIVNNTISFVDADGNNFINAQENCKLRFQVKNRGNGDGHGCTAIISATGTTTGLTYSNISLPTIKSNETIKVEIPISANLNTGTGSVTFSVHIEEPNGFGTDTIKMQVGTRKFENPFIEVVSYQVTGGNGGLLTKRDPFILQIMIQNTGYGVAENIKVEASFPNENSGVFCTSGNKISSIQRLESNEKKIIEYQFIANNNYTSNELPVTIKVSEKHGKYAKNETINLKFGQTIGNNTIIAITGREEQKQTITKGSFYSDVDVNIPQSPTENKNTFAVIIGNENYKSVASVPYALNDSKVFKEYCEKTLGIPTTNIHYLSNATLNEIKKDVSWLKDISEVYKDAQIIFYYAGHGIPDEASKSAYLLPIDGYGSDVSTGYKLDNLYSELGSYATKSVTIFLDACFSGAKREGDMLIAARGVAIRAKAGQPVGNMVVFSAATGDETATGYDNERHGMFTYYLLKKLQETQGNVTYGILGEYIRENVERQSIINGKRQTPTIISSPSIQEDWRMWKLK